MAKKRDREIDVGRLCESMRRARLSLRPYREKRREMVRQFVGQWWSDEGSGKKVPVNLVALYVSVVGRNLIAKNPRVMLSTFERAMKPAVSAMQSWANREVVRTRLQETLQRVVTDALFSVGICKVALATPAESAAMAWQAGAGQPFAADIDLDDFVFDVHAHSFEEVSYIGHRYRVPLDVVRDSKLYNKSRKDLVASEDRTYNLEGDERINVLGRGTYTSSEQEFEDHVDLWEVYLPRHRVVLTLADDSLTGPAAGPGTRQEALREQNWLGPEAGPYHVLAYGVVPGNAMPKGPLQDLMDLHESANRSYRKLMRTADRLKEVLAVSGGATEDGSRAVNAEDGEAIKVDNVERLKMMAFSGAHLQTVLASATTFKDLFAYMAGNLDAMGGLSPQAKTLGQDQLLSENASKSVADMQERTLSHAESVLRALCWYWYNDPFLVQKARHSLPGLPDLQSSRSVTPQMRQRGRFEDIDISVDPYSLRHQTPQSRMQALNQVVTQIVIPMMTLMVQQGISFDVNAYLKKIGEYMDQPDLAEILTIMDPPSPDGGGSGGGGPSGEGPPRPGQTQRTYVRQNMPGTTREASDRNLVSSMMGVKTGGNPDAQQNGKGKQ